MELLSIITVINPMKKHKKSTYLTIPNIVFLTMVFLLGISVVAEILIPTYKTNPLLYAAFGTIAGLAFKSMPTN